MARLYRASYPAGSYVFQQGDVDDRAYIIESGAIEISTRQGGVLAVLPQNDIFGEMGLLDRLERSASAKALEDTSLIVVERSQIQSKVDRADPVLRYLLSLLLDRLRSTHRAWSGETAVGAPTAPRSNRPSRTRSTSCTSTRSGASSSSRSCSWRSTARNSSSSTSRS